jgi:hypothetical protein
VWRALARASTFGIPAVDHEGDAALLETLAEQRAVTIPQRMIKDGGGEPIVLNEEQTCRRLFVIVISAPVGSKVRAISKAMRGSFSTTMIDRPRRVGPCIC